MNKTAELKPYAGQGKHTIKCLRCGKVLVPSKYFVMLNGQRLKGESLGCECGFSMMKAELAYKLYSKRASRWPIPWLLRMIKWLSPKPYKISGCYGDWHYADNAENKNKPN